ncbi:MAG: hypothetical protein ACTHY8_05695 [Microbacterium gubbeenense]|uniref:hypothetical protein n=1 Tax=Microbacterium gubbeenense TaxID=159896 RepID=UPI000424DBD7|nr:hypothetical protein [Microbacterium gubbeenense]
MSVPTRPRPRRALGIVAFIASVSALLLGAIGIWAAGFALGRLVRISDYPDLVQETSTQLWDTLGRAVIAVVILVAAWLVHALIAVWSLVQGIVATAVNRGRAWGIAAIVTASIGWMILLAFMPEALLAGLLGNLPFFG